MSVTMQQVLAEIDRDEPDYSVFPGLGTEALPHLQLIVEANDGLRAAKAAYAASLIAGPGGLDVLTKAAEHADPQVRVAVAHGLRNATGAAGLGAATATPNDLLERLLSDGDDGVRKIALGTTVVLGRSDLSDKIASIAADDPVEFLRDAATSAARKLG